MGTGPLPAQHPEAGLGAPGGDPRRGSSGPAPALAFAVASLFGNQCGTGRHLHPPFCREADRSPPPAPANSRTTGPARSGSAPDPRLPGSDRVQRN